MNEDKLPPEPGLVPDHTIGFPTDEHFSLEPPEDDIALGDFEETQGDPDEDDA